MNLIVYIRCAPNGCLVRNGNGCHRVRRFIKVRQGHRTSSSMHERARNVGAPSQGRPRQGTRSRQRHCEHLHEAAHRGRTSPSPLEPTDRTGSYASTCVRSRQALPVRSDPVRVPSLFAPPGPIDNEISGCERIPRPETCGTSSGTFVDRFPTAFDVFRLSSRVHRAFGMPLRPSLKGSSPCSIVVTSLRAP